MACSSSSSGRSSCTSRRAAATSASAASGSAATSSRRRLLRSSWASASRAQARPCSVSFRSSASVTGSRPSTARRRSISAESRTPAMVTSTMAHRVTAVESFADPALATGDGDLDGRLEAFGAVVAQEIDPAVAELEARSDLPATDGERVEFAEPYARAGRAVWATGVLSVGAYEQGALLFLLAHAGEGGHSCPVVCTAGLV